MNFKTIRQIITYMSRKTLHAIIINCLLIGTMYAGGLNAQTVKSIRNESVVLQLNNAALTKVFKEIELLTDYDFAYQVEDLNRSVRITANFENASVADVLIEVSRQTDLKFKQINNTIHITKRNKEAKFEETIEVVIQGISITGKVIGSDDEEGLPGVNVVVKGTSQGSVTDVEGNYIIEVPDESSVLVFSSVGYISEEFAAGTRTVIDLSMVPDIKALEEIVVIGYGAVKKSDLTGSVAQVKAKDLVQAPASGLNQAMQGRMAGVQVVQGSAAPGGGIKVLIRGTNSINGNNQPLYVIDGFPLFDAGGTGNPQGDASSVSSFNPLSSINVNDIESIEVLKDASATAIYGSRGANGVVLVTTKSGKAGSSVLTYDGYYGVQEVNNLYDLMNAQQFAEFTNEKYKDESFAPIFGGSDPSLPDPSTLGEGTDWQDEVFRVAPIQNHQLSLSGGNDKLSHFISLGYYDQEGVVKNTGIKRASIRTNVTGKHKDWLKYGFNLNYSYTQNNLANVEGAGFGENSSIIAAALGMSPHYSTVPDDDGFYEWMEIPPLTAQLDNPLSRVYNNFDDVIKNYFYGNAFLDFRLAEGLNLKVSLGSTLSNSNRNIYYPSTSRYGSTYEGRGRKSSQGSTSWLNENTLTYNKTINEVHSFNLVAGFSYQGTTRTSFASGQSIFFPNDVTYYDPANAVSMLGKNSAGKVKNTLASYYGRINYNFNDKYLISLTGRSDGSSTFGENNKWALFPAAAIAWRAINEDFIRNLDLFTDLKFRASYGTSGNSGSAYQSLVKGGTNRVQSAYVYNGTNTVSAFYADGIQNKDLRWELTTTTNFGIDFGFLNNRLTFTTDYYYKKTTDLILFQPIPSSSGYRTIISNVGDVENQGVELAVNATPIDKTLKWSFNANISFNRNKVLNLGDQDELFQRVSGYPTAELLTWVIVGKPTGLWRLYEWDGIYKTQEELEAGPIINDNTEVGDPRFVDQNGDGIINPLDRVIAGDPNPDFYYGFSNNFSYKNFELNIFIQGVQGGDILNMTKAELIKSTTSVNQHISVLDSWSESNPDGNLPRSAIGRNGVFTSTNNVEDGSYVRLKNVTLAYNLNTVKFLKNARIYVSGTNLLTITNYTGYDPEVSASLGKLSTGIDNFNYPNSRTYTLGFVLDF